MSKVAFLKWDHRIEAVETVSRYCQQQTVHENSQQRAMMITETPWRPPVKFHAPYFPSKHFAGLKVFAKYPRIPSKPLVWLSYANPPNYFVTVPEFHKYINYTTDWDIPETYMEIAQTNPQGLFSVFRLEVDHSTAFINRSTSS